MKRTPANSVPLLITSCFLAACCAIFTWFSLEHPLDWQQPETLRLHYYALQSGLKDGPLSAALSLNDLAKPLAWKAQGGMFDGRYPIMLLDGLIPKLYQFFYPFTGPFLAEPVNYFLIAVTVFLIIILIHEWFASRPAALMVGGGWLLTSQTLLDSRYPIRPNMALLGALFVYILWELARLRSRERAPASCLRIGLVFVFALFCHEYTIILIPVIFLVILMEWSKLRRHLLPVALTVFGGCAVFLAALVLILPPLARLVTGELPTLGWVKGGVEPLLRDPALLPARFRDYVVVGFRELFRQSLGCGIYLPLRLKLAGVGSFLVFLAVFRRSDWKRSLGPWLIAFVYFVLTALLMFPVIPPSVDMPVYYYTPIVILFLLPFGALLSGLNPSGDRLRWTVAGGAWLVIGLLNMKQCGSVMGEMPGSFGFNPVMRGYVRDILEIRDRSSPENISPRVYTAYPRPRNFDISRRWDIMLRVWHGESEQIFSMMLPVLCLKLFEEQILLGAPDEFEATAGIEPAEYEAQANIYWDMPKRKLYNLDYLRELPSVSGNGWELIWKRRSAPAGSASSIPAPPAPGLFGDTPRVTLPPGEWTLKFPLSGGGEGGSLVLLLALRADLMPSGPEDVMDRIQPLPLRKCSLSVRDDKTGAEIYAGAQFYGWSYQLFQIPLEGLPGRGLDILIESTADLEVVGPVLRADLGLAGDSWTKDFNGEMLLK